MDTTINDNTINENTINENTINENTINENSKHPHSLYLHSLLDNLIEKYKTNDYVFGRLVNSIENLLPITLENATETHKQREERRLHLSENRDVFTSSFLEKNKYFYSSQTELFLH